MVVGELICTGIESDATLAPVVANQAEEARDTAHWRVLSRRSMISAAMPLPTGGLGMLVVVPVAALDGPVVPINQLLCGDPIRVEHRFLRVIRIPHDPRPQPSEFSRASSPVEGVAGC